MYPVLRKRAGETKKRRRKDGEEEEESERRRSGERRGGRRKEKNDEKEEGERRTTTMRRKAKGGGRGGHHHSPPLVRSVPRAKGRSPRLKVDLKATLEVKSCPRRSRDRPDTPSSASLAASVFSWACFSLSLNHEFSLASLLAA